MCKTIWITGHAICPVFCLYPTDLFHSVSQMISLKWYIEWKIILDKGCDKGGCKGLRPEAFWWPEPGSSAPGGQVSELYNP